MQVFEDGETLGAPVRKALERGATVEQLWLYAGEVCDTPCATHPVWMWMLTEGRFQVFDGVRRWEVARHGDAWSVQDAKGQTAGVEVAEALLAAARTYLSRHPEAWLNMERAGRRREVEALLRETERARLDFTRMQDALREAQRWDAAYGLDDPNARRLALELLDKNFTGSPEELLGAVAGALATQL